MSRKQKTGKNIYLTYDELWWIHTTMMNQHGFGNDDHEKLNDSIYRKTDKAMDSIHASQEGQI